MPRLPRDTSPSIQVVCRCHRLLTHRRSRYCRRQMTLFRAGNVNFNRRLVSERVCCSALANSTSRAGSSNEGRRNLALGGRARRRSDDSLVAPPPPPPAQPPPPPPLARCESTYRLGVIGTRAPHARARTRMHAPAGHSIFSFRKPPIRGSVTNFVDD